MQHSLPASAIEEALDIIAATPGYRSVAGKLRRLAARGRIYFHAGLEDRARAGLAKTITLGPEAMESHPLSLAQTLVHEHYHLHQNPFLKTVSFWSGVATRTPVMRRYERPAYRAADEFLEAVKKSQPSLAAIARAEQEAIRRVFAQSYGGDLMSTTDE